MYLELWQQLSCIGLASIRISGLLSYHNTSAKADSSVANQDQDFAISTTTIVCKIAYICHSFISHLVRNSDKIHHIDRHLYISHTCIIPSCVRFCYPYYHHQH